MISLRSLKKTQNRLLKKKKRNRNNPLLDSHVDSIMLFSRVAVLTGKNACMTRSPMQTWRSLTSIAMTSRDPKFSPQLDDRGTMSHGFQYFSTWASTNFYITRRISNSIWISHARPSRVLIPLLPRMSLGPCNAPAAWTKHVGFSGAP